MAPRYNEGTWFAIPLPQGGYAVGVVARRTPKGGVIVAYLFGPERKVLPSLDEVESLTPNKALKVWRLGDFHLAAGKWPIIGISHAWKREDWPIPQYVRVEPLAGKAWRVTYSDLDATKIVSEERISDGDTNHDRDSMHGSSNVEKALGKLISS